MIENIQFNYFENTKKNEIREAAIRKNLNDWLQKFEHELNRTGIITNVNIYPDNRNNVHFLNIETELNERIFKHMQKYDVWK